jgi:DNA-binding NarL/FixJ family response regulator
MKPRIIIADDSPDVLPVLVSVLSPEFEVIATAPDGRSALELIQRLKPEAAVLDLNMPGLNGIEVTREIMRLGRDCCVVICSVESDPDLIAVAKSAGALGYVLKPRLNHDLVVAVKGAVEGDGLVFPPS